MLLKKFSIACDLKSFKYFHNFLLCPDNSSDTGRVNLQEENAKNNHKDALFYEIIPVHNQG